MPFGLIFLLVVIFRIMIYYYRKNSLKRRQKKTLVEVFTNEHITLPLLEFGSSYGWPTFTVKFSSKEDYEYARKNELFKLFDKRIALFYDLQFRSNMAVDYTYPDKYLKWDIALLSDEDE